MYYVEFEDFAGVRRRLSTGERDKDIARIKGLDIMRQAMLDDAKPATRSAVNERQHTLTHALEECLRTRWAGQKSGKVRKFSVRAIQRDIGHWPLHAITYKKLMDYCEKLLADKKPATVNRHMAYISTSLRESAKRGEINAVPSIPHFAENNVKERYLSSAEEAAILDHLLRMGAAHADYAYMHDLVALLLDSGMRCTEALTIQQSQYTDGRVRLLHGDTKSGKGRLVPLTGRARAALSRMFWHPLHLKVNADWAGRRWRTSVAKVGLEELTLHTLRHTCASRLIQRGVDIYLVSKWLGHSSLEITKRYAHLAPTSLDAAMSVLEAGCATNSTSGIAAKPLEEKAEMVLSTNAVASTTGEMSTRDTVPAVVGTVVDDKLLIDLVISGAKGETRSDCSPAQSIT
jgi:integrase